MSKEKTKNEPKLEYVMDGPTLSNEMLSMFGDMTNNDNTPASKEYDTSLNKLGKDLQNMLKNNDMDLVFEKGKLVTKKK
jgi:hypothetical protein